MGDDHPHETAGPSSLATDRTETTDRAGTNVRRCSADSSFVEEIESEATFTFATHRLKRKLRCHQIQQII